MDYILTPIISESIASNNSNDSAVLGIWTPHTPENLMATANSETIWISFWTGLVNNDKADYHIVQWKSEYCYPNSGKGSSIKIDTKYGKATGDDEVTYNRNKFIGFASIGGGKSKFRFVYVHKLRIIKEIYEDCGYTISVTGKFERAGVVYSSATATVYVHADD